MKNYTITEDQIKKLSTQDQIVEEYLNEWVPDAFKKELEIGKWYISNDVNKHIFYVTKITEDRYYYYGFNSCGNWCNNDYYSFNDYGLKNGFRLATEEETSSILIKEAVKRGFKDGAYVNNSMIEFNGYTPSGSRKCKLNFKQGYSAFYKFNDLRIKGTTPCNSAFIIFKDGIWASILKEVTLNYNQIADKFGIDVEQLRITKL